MADLINPWYIATLLGAPETWVIIIALLFGAHLAFRTGSLGGEKTKQLLFRLVPAMVLTFIIVIALKGYLNFPRQCVPCITELVGCNPLCPLDSSMPSGHSAVAFAGIATVFLAARKRQKWLPIFIIPFLVAVSRVMLGVHTWLDVVAGACVGILIALAVMEIDKKV